ncbi:MAG: cytochrome C biosynthesis protein [Candidatus Cardinium sp.]|nr:cytochrome C biosynthesis protein [Candidatus Cardinium sp.]
MKLVNIDSVPRATSAKELAQSEKTLQLAIKRKNRSYYCIGCLLVLVPIMVYMWNLYQSKKDLQAKKEAAQAICFFESANFAKALEGEGAHKGFLSIIELYPYTSTACLMHFYAGISYMHQKQYDQAIASLKKFSSKDFIVQARAYAVIADAYSEQRKYKQAAIYYKQAANYKPNSVYTPHYLVKAANAFEEVAQYKQAYDCYNAIEEKYPNAQLNREGFVAREKGRLSMLLSN